MGHSQCFYPSRFNMPAFDDKQCPTCHIGVQIFQGCGRALQSDLIGNIVLAFPRSVDKAWDIWDFEIFYLHNIDY